MTCTCTADHKCLFCAGVTTNDNPFTDAGALLIESLESRGQRAYGPQWPALRTHMTATHSDGRTSNVNALRHNEAMGILDVIRTECPHAFAMKKNWKPANPDYKRPPSKATPELVDIQRRDSVAASRCQSETSLTIRHSALIRNPYPGDVAKFRQHLAQQILSGKLKHAEIVAMGNVNGYDGVRLGCENDDGRGNVWVRCIDTSLRFNERQFVLLVRRHFA